MRRPPSVNAVARIRVDGDEPVEHEPRVEVGADLAPVVCLPAAALERLGDGHRRRGEHGVRAEQRDRELRARVHAQREQQLEGGDAAAGHEHPRAFLGGGHATLSRWAGGGKSSANMGLTLRTARGAANGDEP